MAALHPHAEATYLVSALDDGKFMIEVEIPGTRPTRVTGLETEEAASAWIERHKASIATGTINRRPNWGGRGR